MSSSGEDDTGTVVIRAGTGTKPASVGSWSITATGPTFCPTPIITTLVETGASGQATNACSTTNTMTLTGLCPGTWTLTGGHTYATANATCDAAVSTATESATQFCSNDPTQLAAGSPVDCTTTTTFTITGGTNNIYVRYTKANDATVTADWEGF